MLLTDQVRTELAELIRQAARATMPELHPLPGPPAVDATGRALAILEAQLMRLEGELSSLTLTAAGLLARVQVLERRHEDDGR